MKNKSIYCICLYGNEFQSVYDFFLETFAETEEQIQEIIENRVNNFCGNDKKTYRHWEVHKQSIEYIEKELKHIENKITELLKYYNTLKQKLKDKDYCQIGTYNYEDKKINNYASSEISPLLKNIQNKKIMDVIFALHEQNIPINYNILKMWSNDIPPDPNISTLVVKTIKSCF